eukprot:jgi/Orpsp1_1/1192235/evm.model.d7180000091609.1
MGYNSVMKSQNNNRTDFANFSFAQTTKKIHLIDILILNNSTRFDTIVKSIVEDVFNPATLFPRIDELKEMIRPYVELDKIPDENGKYPGKLNEKSEHYSFAEWEANCEFTNIKSIHSSKAYGLKYWILAKYRSVCQSFHMECDATYLDENYQYTIDESLEAPGEDIYVKEGIPGNPPNGNPPNGNPPNGNPPNENPPNGNPPNGNPPNENPQNGNPPANNSQNDDNPPANVPKSTEIKTETETKTETEFEIPTQTMNDLPESTITTVPASNQYQCWSELLGYPCCDSNNSNTVYLQDSYGDWGYDFTTKRWCGITAYEEPNNDEQCWSETFGYPCCKGCTIYETDSQGSWGYENNEWCGIQSYC